jgi:hypothetical protein
MEVFPIAGKAGLKISEPFQVERDDLELRVGQHRDLGGFFMEKSSMRYSDGNNVSLLVCSSMAG